MDYILNKLKMILIGQDKLKNNTNTTETSNLNNSNIVDNNINYNDIFSKPASYKNLNSSASYTD